MDFFKLFGIVPSKTTRPLGDLFNDLERMLVDRSENEVKFLAGVGGLLGKVALSDDEISSDELQVIRDVLLKATDLSRERYDSILMLLERHTNELRGIQDHRYTQLVNDVASVDEKRQILHWLFAVAAANGVIEFAEDSAISFIAKALRLSHEDFIAARIAARELLS
ncbi:MAG: TerB family tellurite resistance protein [Bdellovibrionales bacterium]|nr:TerB family tellurite resistance protein [Bdellovibrionales bacterium]